MSIVNKGKMKTSNNVKAFGADFSQTCSPKMVVILPVQCIAQIVPQARFSIPLWLKDIRSTNAINFFKG